MAKDYSRKLFHSRLARREEKRSLRKAFFFVLLTIVLLVVLVFLGIPALVKVAVFFADIKSTGTPVEQTDTVPPPAPRFNILPEYTKEPSLSLSGFAEAGSTVEIFLNDSPVGSIVVTNEGTFSFAKVNLSPDKNEIYAVSTDTAGNKSQPSPKITINFDNTPPKLEIGQPQDGASFVGERKRKIKIEGQTEENISLALNERLVILGAEGKFSADFTLADGENILKLLATDRAGNQTEKEIKVAFTP